MTKYNENKLVTYISYIFVALSLIVGTFGCFWLYINKYLNSDDALKAKISNLMDEIHVFQDKRMIYMILMSCVVMLLLWVLGFVMYKVIFNIAKVVVKDIELIIAIGSAYTLSFLAGYYFIDRIDALLVVVIVNVVEICVVYMGLFDKIKKRIGICILLRSIVMVLDVVIALSNK